MDKAQCVALFSLVLCAVVCSSIPGDFQRKDQREHSVAPALAQKLERFSGWQGNMAQEAGLSPWSIIPEPRYLLATVHQGKQRTRLPSSALFLDRT